MTAMPPRVLGDPLATLPRDLPYEDGKPMDSPLHRAQMELLIDCTLTRWHDRTDFYCGGDMFVHYSPERARNRDFRGPDFFVVLGTELNRPRLYWAPWDEGGLYPNVIVELLSPTTAVEDRTTKFEIYERIFRTSEYFLYDMDTHELEGYRLARRYRRIEADSQGRLWSEELGCWLGNWDGSFHKVERTWLRFSEPAFQLIPTAAEAERQIAETERQKAVFEQKRADDTADENARLKAELERLRAGKP
jgi:Uma2 family endonuclease